MQTYVVSNILRTIGGRVGLLFCMLFISFVARSTENPTNAAVERDTLFTKWNRSRSTLPTLIYKLRDFDHVADRVEAESLIRTYGIGGVIIKGGRAEEVSKWTVNNRKWRKQPVIHGVEITNVFELPFDNLPDFPNQTEVECLTRDHLVYILGQSHAYQLKQMGIGFAEFANFPKHYTSHEFKKLRSYIQGLSDGGIWYYVSDQSLASEAHPVLSSILDHSTFLVPDQITNGEVLGKKTLKNYRKESQDRRALIDSFQDIESALNQMDLGVTLLTVSGQSKSQNLINAMLLDDMPDKKCYKKEVKTFFGLVAEIEQELNLPPNQVFKWTNQSDNFAFEAVTLVQDNKRLLPIGSKSKLFTISDDSEVFESRVDRYQTATHLPIESLLLETDSLLKVISPDAVVIVEFDSKRADSELELLLSGIIDLSAHRSIVVLGSNQKLLDLSAFTNISILWAPESAKVSLGIMVEMAFGARAISGALPGYLAADGSRRGEFREATGKLTYEPGYTLDQTRLDQIEVLVNEAIAEGVMPGCQIMMVKDGRVVYDQNFGYLTYDSLAPVRWNHLYDIASVTKTVATLPLIMSEVEKGEISLDGQLGDYLPAFLESDKASLELGDLLTHQSGLKSYIPFWRRAAYNEDRAEFLYKKRIRRNTYKHQSVNWQDSIQSWIANSRYNRLSNDDGTFRYLYSDLGFMVMKDIAETKCACALDETLDQNVYQPMGMDHTTFNPLRKFDKTQIAPTEQDKYFRSELLQGVVHDKNAALLGGVSGHAGLFSNANDLAKFMYMMLHGGKYGGVQYFSDSLIRTFISRQRPEDRRALGWDKPNRSVGNASRYASDASFGHSGFTGTLVWADPNYDLIYIFLSNRIYPDPQNYKLIEKNTRTKIHDLMYESFLNIDGERNPDM